MEYTREVQVVMLPTNKEPVRGDVLYRKAFDDISLWRYKDTYTYGDGTTVFRTLDSSFEDWHVGMKPMYLYVVSDDELEAGDWVFLPNKKVMQLPNEARFIPLNNFTGGYSLSDCKKIVATNDPSVRFATGEMYPEWDYLPCPDEQFILDYIKDFNSKRITTFKIPKNSWSREEVVELLIKNEYDNHSQAEAYTKSPKFLRWVEKNL